jgi:hypothetical protein
MKAQLAGQGVRGGQAVTQLNRSVGGVARDTQEDLDQIIAQDAQNRQNQKLAYESSKAGLGNQFLTSAQTAQNYDAAGNPLYGSLSTKVNPITAQGYTPSTIDQSQYKQAAPAQVDIGSTKLADTSAIKDYNPINTAYNQVSSELTKQPTTTTQTNQPLTDDMINNILNGGDIPGNISADDLKKLKDMAQLPNDISVGDMGGMMGGGF